MLEMAGRSLQDLATSIDDDSGPQRDAESFRFVDVFIHAERPHDRFWARGGDGCGRDRSNRHGGGETTEK